MLRQLIVFMVGLCLSASAFAELKNCVDDLGSYVHGDSLVLTCKMTPEEVPVLVDYLRAHPSVTGLTLAYDNGRAILTMNNISLILALPTLKTLDLHWNISLRPEIVEYITQSETLKSLDISYDQISKQALENLATNHSIETLNLSGVTDVYADDFNILVMNEHLKKLTLFTRQLNNRMIQAVANIPTLEVFYFGDEDADMLVSEETLLKLANNKHFKKLGIVSQHVTVPVMKALSDNPNLTYLLLSGDSITDDGALYLKNMPNLRRLIIDENNIGNAGLSAIGENASLRVLSAEENLFSEAGVLAFAKKTQVVQLDLSQNKGITLNSLAAIFNIASLKTLDLAMTGLMDDEAVMLAKQDSLICMNVSDNHIGSVGAKAFAEMGNIDYLDVRGNELSPAENLAIAQNTAIKHLWADNFPGNVYGFVSCVDYVKIT